MVTLPFGLLTRVALKLRDHLAFTIDPLDKDGHCPIKKLKTMK